MSLIPKELLYTKEHEWLKKTSNPKVVLIGITDFAQSSLGDITYLDLPAVGKDLVKDKVFGSVESVKSVSELFAPVSGKILKVNQELLSDPAPLNSSPYEAGWLLEVEIQNESELSTLLSPEAYQNIAQ